MLDEWDAANRPHREIARWVAAQLSIEPLAWDAQAITASYELTRGLRAIGEKEDGFAITASRTVAVPVERLYDAFVKKPLRRRWLPDAELSPRTTTRPKSARFDWGDGGTRVNVTFLAKGEDKSTVALEHRRPSRRRRGRPDEGLLARAARRSQGGTGAISDPRIASARKHQANGLAIRSSSQSKSWTGHDNSRTGTAPKRSHSSRNRFAPLRLAHPPAASVGRRLRPQLVAGQRSQPPSNARWAGCSKVIVDYVTTAYCSRGDAQHIEADLARR